MEFNAAQFGDYATDPDLETGGVKIYLNEDKAVWFMIRRAGGSNRAYDREVARLSKPFKRDLQRGTMGNEDAEQKIILPAFVQTCVTGWGGIKDVNGKDIPFSTAACRALFIDFPDIFDTLKGYADEMSTYRRQDMEETADRLGES